MIHPSYAELSKKINDNAEGEQKVINSRYSVCIATAKRARQIIDGAEPLVDDIKCQKPLSIAVQELYEGKVNILPDETVEK
ncbi:MAG: DNA-directed RNA polymerase subunit omega [Lachnospiraceae bacterium]|nr:DNA-directed RNA polymerase subunit omega [Lachnospiraceae bacterium]